MKFVKFVAIRKAVLIVYVITTKQTMKRFEYFLGSFAPFRSFGWNVPGTTTHQSTTKTRKPGNFNICAKLFATKISDILLSLKFFSR